LLPRADPGQKNLGRFWLESWEYLVRCGDGGLNVSIQIDLESRQNKSLQVRNWRSCAIDSHQEEDHGPHFELRFRAAWLLMAALTVRGLHSCQSPMHDKTGGACSE